MIDVKTEKLISLSAAARQLGVNRDYIRRLVESGQIDGVKVGNRIKTSFEALERYALPYESRPKVTVEKQRSGATAAKLRARGL
jgi:excisionase family DNA binding protein